MKMLDAPSAWFLSSSSSSSSSSRQPPPLSSTNNNNNNTNNGSNINNNTMRRDDDDGSVSSTMSVKVNGVSSCSASNDDSTSNNKKSLKRRVSFNESDNVHHDNCLYAREDSFGLWYTALEYQSFKNKRSLMARKLSHQANSSSSSNYGSTFGLHYFGGSGSNCNRQDDQDDDDAYASIPPSLVHVLDSTYQLCCEGESVLNPQLQRLEQDRLRERLSHYFAQYGEHVVGLERRACSYISVDRARCRHELGKLVQILQHHVEWPNDEKLEQELEWHCAKMSYGARLFAQILAEAQFQELQQQEPPQASSDDEEDDEDDYDHVGIVACAMDE